MNKLTLVLCFLVGGMTPFVAQAQSELRVAARPCQNNASYNVHFSFDDGPSIPQTIRILDILKKHNIKATFLISMDKFSSFAEGGTPTKRELRLLDVINRMKAEGHTVGSHSYAHIDHGAVNSLGERQIMTNLQRSFNASRALGLSNPSPFRFPYGSGWLPSRNTSWNERLMSTIRANGHVPFHWDLDTEDWHRTRRKALPTSLLNQICSSGGGVALMHDIHPWTVDNLETLILSVQQSGHNFVSYQQIINDDRRSTRDDPRVERTQRVRQPAPPTPSPQRQEIDWSGGIY